MTMTMSNVKKSQQVAFDQEVKEFLELDKQIKLLKAELEERKALLESRYKFSAEVVEKFEGIKYTMEKIPVRRGKDFDCKQLKAYITECTTSDVAKEVVSRHVVYEVNEKKLKQLVKDNVVPQVLIDKTISYSTITFKSKFTKK